MWAMMPMLRVFSRGYCRSTSAPQLSVAYMRRGGLVVPPSVWIPLPAIVSEGLVGLRHLVGVLSLLDRRPAVVGRVQQFGRQLVGHAPLGPSPGRTDDPAHGQRRTPIGAYLDRDLVRRATDPARLHLDRGLDVVDGGLEH